jgi:hypothetical protein
VCVVGVGGASVRVMTGDRGRHAPEVMTADRAAVLKDAFARSAGSKPAVPPQSLVATAPPVIFRSYDCGAGVGGRGGGEARDTKSASARTTHNALDVRPSPWAPRVGRKHAQDQAQSKQWPWRLVGVLLG